jgi:peptide/nickel transport system ATP-binding protein
VSGQQAAGAGGAALLEVNNLSVEYRGSGSSIAAVRDVSFVVRPGEMVALIGESGSGKTTIARSIVGLLEGGGRVTGGDIRFGGQVLTTLSQRRLRAVRGRNIGFVPQDPGVSLDPLMPIGDQVAEVLKVHGLAGRRTAAAAAIEVLELVGLQDARARARQYPHQLSGGMRQRVLIGIAVACHPKLVIADEPTSALDVTTQRRVLDHLTALVQQSQTALLLITHDLGVAADRAQRLLVMKEGHLVEEGDVTRLLASPQHPYTRQLMAAVPDVHGPRLTPTAGIIARRPRNDADVAGETGADATAADIAQPDLLTVTGLAKTFRLSSVNGAAQHIRAVDGISFIIPKRHTFALVGESGCGKSTTARLVLRLVKPTSGSVALGGTDITALRGSELRAVRRRMQVVYQDPFASFDPRGTIASLVEEPLRAFGEPDRRNRVASLIDRVALPRTVLARKPAELSGGQLQRAAIARALTLQPDLVVLDEPVSALDVSVQAEVLQLLVDLQAEFGLSYLFISHDLGVVRQISDSVAVMRSGRLVEVGPADRVLAAPEQPYTRELLAAVPGAVHSKPVRTAAPTSETAVRSPRE